MNENVSPNYESSSHSGKPEAIIDIDAAPSIDSPIKRRKLLRKIDSRVLPALIVVYFLAFLDRVNIGNALIYKLPQDLNLQGLQTNIALCVFFVGYIVCEIPANILMKKTKPHIFLSASMFCFGLLTILQGFVHNFGGLVTTRLLLGVAEAGVYPGSFYIISMWYKRSEAQRRCSLFLTAVSISAAFGGLLASAIGKMDGVRGYSAWRWIFILEGLLTCVVSFGAFFTVTDFPECATFLNESERAYVIERLAADQGSSGHEVRITFSAVIDTFKDWKMIPAGLMYFGVTTSGYALAYFIPSIVSTYHYSPIRSQLFSVPPWAATMVYALLIAYLSDKFRNRSAFILIGLCLAVTGNVVLLTVHDYQKVQYAGLILYAMGIFSTVPIIICWFTMNLRGHKNRAVGAAWQIAVGNIGCIVAIFSFPSRDAPRYVRGYSLGLGCMGLTVLMGTAYFVGCLRENRRGMHEPRLLL
ncbi:hypothetical protein GJ744_008379 [Endocarpon pusillum]|uniref:Major facilitator superfamily (MFS) profile domain-containing protein n=1 Tax=Endocarpon pusillum TaxID=364733 RepID=A0A8H7ALI8_9EURO|nr:hypothetical protein GJ744_008379 [Endocarpon pusillum]